MEIYLDPIQVKFACHGQGHSSKFKVKSWAPIGIFPRMGRGHGTWRARAYKGCLGAEPKQPGPGGGQGVRGKATGS